MKLKLCILAFVFLITGCNHSDEKEHLSSTKTINDCYEIVVSGQSNAEFEWSYFEELTGLKVKNIAKGGHSIDDLIAAYSPFCVESVVAIFFIHGEHDAMNGTGGDYYAESVERYRLMIKDVPMFISLVGYTSNPDYDYKFDYLREYQKGVVVFSDAKKFRDWGMLRDDIHFNKDAQIMVMDAFAEAIFTYDGL